MGYYKPHSYITRTNEHVYYNFACQTCMCECEYKVLDSCVRGHHVYNSIWAPTVGEKLVCEVEFRNIHDPYVHGSCT